MSQASPLKVDWKQICAKAGPYPKEAFDFVHEGLTHTVNTVHADPERLPETGHHVSGQQLCIGLRDYAILKYGMLAPVVLSHWRVARTDDFGRIVFAMIDAGIMSKTSQDSLDDFRGVYDFAEVFSPEQVAAKLRSSGAAARSAT